jgi:hypothetical protein
MTAQPQRTVLELIRSAAARGAAAHQERSYLLPEDLLDDPIEWSLGEASAEGTQRSGTLSKVFSLH